MTIVTRDDVAIESVETISFSGVPVLTPARSRAFTAQGDGVEAVNAYNLACDNGITAVFGATLTGPTIALADATYEDNMPQVTASATASGVTMIDPDDPDSEIRQNVFRACFIDQLF